MKSGKIIRLPRKRNIAVTYGSVNTRNLKSVYIKLSCWVQPKFEHDNWNVIITRLRREIKMSLFHKLNKGLFNENFIVDMDLRSSGIYTTKRSFWDCEITLYIAEQLDIRSPEFTADIETVVDNILDDSKTLFKEFNVFETKKGS